MKTSSQITDVIFGAAVFLVLTAVAAVAGTTLVEAQSTGLSPTVQRIIEVVAQASQSM